MRVIFLKTKERTDLRDDLARAAIKEGRAMKEEDYDKPVKKENKEVKETKELKTKRQTK